MTAKYIIRLENVWKTYHIGGTVINALAGIHLNIEEGEFISIMGPSGSGKSTMVNMVGCLDVPSQGSIYLKGANIAHMTESQLAQIRGKTIGFIFQQFNLIPTLTTIQNVMLPMSFLNMPAWEREQRARTLLDLVQLTDRMENKPTQLSGGQQQRVAIARALANDPDVILADEPTGNLDSKTGMIVLDYLKELHKKGKTIIMVTHDAKLAHHAERTVFLKDGKTCCKL